MVPPLMVISEEFVAYKPQPSTPSHPLMMPSLMVIFEEFVAYKPPPLFIVAEHSLIAPPLMVTVDLSAYKPPPAPASHPLIVPLSILMIEPFVAYKPPPAPKLALHSLIVLPLMVISEEFVAYKPPPAPIPAVHSLIVPPVMVIFEEFVAPETPPHLPSHPLIVPRKLMLMIGVHAQTAAIIRNAIRISPPDAVNVAPESAITARLRAQLHRHAC